MLNLLGAPRAFAPSLCAVIQFTKMTSPSWHSLGAHMQVHVRRRTFRSKPAVKDGNIDSLLRPENVYHPKPSPKHTHAHTHRLFLAV